MLYCLFLWCSQNGCVSRAGSQYLKIPLSGVFTPVYQCSIVFIERFCSLLVMLLKLQCFRFFQIRQLMFIYVGLCYMLLLYCGLLKVIVGIGVVFQNLFLFVRCCLIICCVCFSFGILVIIGRKYVFDFIVIYFVGFSLGLWLKQRLIFLCYRCLFISFVRLLVCCCQLFCLFSILVICVRNCIFCVIIVLMFI